MSDRPGSNGTNGGGKVPAAAYHTLFKRLPVAMAIFRTDGSLKDVNTRAAQIMGRPRRELLDAYNIVSDPQALAQGLDQAFSRALAGEEIRLPAMPCGPGVLDKGDEFPLEGDTRTWVETLFHPLDKDQEGEDLVCCVYLEVTDRMKAQAALKNSYQELEQRVEDRTFALRKANLELQREIMERERMEDELRIAQEEYRSILDNATVGVFRITSEGAFLDVNPELCRIYGCEDRDQFLERNPDMSGLFLEPAAWRLFLDELTAQGGIRDFEAMHRGCAAQNIWATLSARAVVDELGRISGFEGFLSDVSVRKAAEEALRASEQRYRGLFENSHDGIFLAVPAGPFLNVNPAMARILGYDSPEHFLAEVRDPDTQLYMQPEERAMVVTKLREHGSIEDMELRVLTRDGGNIWTSLNAKLVPGDEDHPLLVEGTARDITNRKRTERRLDVLIRHLKTAVQDRTKKLTEKASLLEEANERLRSLDEMKSAFLSSVSHELRTPMTSILGFAKMIGKEFDRRFQPLVGEDQALAKSASRIIENLEIIWQEGERLTRLINDVLDLNKIESGFMEWRDQEVRLDHVLEQAVDAVRGQFALKPSLRLEVVPEADLPPAIADPDRLTQVLVNLLNNAAKFTRDGTVTVTAARQDPDRILVRVRDTGEGIPPEDLEIIFDKFRQARSQGRPVAGPQGTGLGLTICRQIVERYGGAIWAESTLGAGSTFFFTLPTVAAGNLPTSRPVAP